MPLGLDRIVAADVARMWLNVAQIMRSMTKGKSPVALDSRSTGASDW